MIASLDNITILFYDMSEIKLTTIKMKQGKSRKNNDSIFTCQKYQKLLILFSTEFTSLCELVPTNSNSTGRLHIFFLWFVTTF